MIAIKRKLACMMLRGTYKHYVLGVTEENLINKNKIMTNKQNFVKLDRGIGESQIWEKPSDWLKIWIWLLKEARYSKPTDAIPLWCILTNYKYIEGFCRVSYKSIENCMRWMKLEGMVVVQKRNRLVLIELQNWERFQTSSGTGRELQGVWQEFGSSTIIVERKKERKKEVYIWANRSEVLEELNKIIMHWNNTWSEKRIITEKLQEVYLKVRKTYSKDIITKALTTYKEEKIDTDRQYRLDPLRFFSQSNWFLTYV